MLKLALLEDSPWLLKDLMNIFDDHKIGAVIIHNTKSSAFIPEVLAKKPDALVLDIDLNGDSMSGIDVANHLNLPTFFITGHIKNFIEQFETLKLSKEVPVEFMSKPINTEKLINLFQKFEKNIQAFAKIDYLKIRLQDYPYPQVKQADIVFIQSVFNSKSNAKEIQLSTRENTYHVARKSMESFFTDGLNKAHFVQTSQSHIVNRQYLNEAKIKRGDKQVDISYEIKGKTIKKSFEITEEYWSSRRNR